LSHNNKKPVDLKGKVQEIKFLKDPSTNGNSPISSKKKPKKELNSNFIFKNLPMMFHSQYSISSNPLILLNQEELDLKTK